jgi:hypothetical protein
MNDDRAKMVLIRDLTPWAKNPRKNDPAVDAVADSIRRFGFASPILARLADGRVIAGHTRLKAAIKLGMEAVPVRYLDLDVTAANALALADNKLGELAEWDDAALAEILSGLGDDAKGLGWNDDEIASLLAEMPDGAAWDAGMDGLQDEDRPPFQQMTFTLHDDQVAEVKDALAAAIALGPFVGPNGNSNGNALARIVEMWRGAR